MAYDRYAAIWKPLHFTTIMWQGLCQLLVVVACINGILQTTVQILFMINLTFCGPKVTDHFMCDFFSLLKLACSDTYKLSIVVAANPGAMCLLIFACSSFPTSSWAPWKLTALKDDVNCSLHVPPTLQWWCSFSSLVYSPICILWPLTLLTSGWLCSFQSSLPC